MVRWVYGWRGLVVVTLHNPSGMRCNIQIASQSGLPKVIATVLLSAYKLLQQFGSHLRGAKSKCTFRMSSKPKIPGALSLPANEQSRRAHAFDAKGVISPTWTTGRPQYPAAEIKWGVVAIECIRKSKRGLQLRVIWGSITRRH